MSEALPTIAGNVRNTATVLAVWVVAKGPNADLGVVGHVPRARR